MEKRLLVPLVALVILSIGAVLTTGITSVSAQQTVISVPDPEGDDRGPGYYGYPTAGVFKPGVFDIVRFEVSTNATHVIFRTFLKDLGGNPWNGPNGFCLQYVQIYIRTTETGLVGRMDTFGLNIVLRPDYAWYYAILLAPGWDEQPVPVGQKAALYYSNGSVVVQDTKGFRVYADTATNSIVAVVPKTLLSDTDNIGKWRIVVGVASYDGFGPYRVRPVSATGGEWVVNGSAYATPDQVKKLASAIAKGVEPRVMDLLVYSPEYPNGISKEDQYRWLDSYDPVKSLPATVPYTPAVQVVTQVMTTTYTTTYTQTAYVTHTTVSPTTIVSLTTTTSVETRWDVAAGVGIVLLVIGFVIGYMLRRR